MIDAHSRAVLTDVVRRENRSLLQYVSESFPWTTPDEKRVLARLEEMVGEERSGVAALGRFLLKHHVIPAPLAPYPMSFTNINYISLDHLVPLLIEYHTRHIGELEAAMKSMADADSRAQAEAYLAMKRRHQEQLKEMLAALAKKTPVAS